MLKTLFVNNAADIDFSAKPRGWGSDHLTAFLDLCRGNAFASFHNLPQEYARLRDLDDIFCSAVDACASSCDPIPAMLMARTHSAFLAAAQLVLNGQIPESYACMRSVLEWALYAFHLSRSPDREEAWLRRHDGEQFRERVRREFAVGGLKKGLAVANPGVVQRFEKLYERVIDMGAHPNERALTSNAEYAETAAGSKFEVAYLVAHESSLLLGLKTCAQVGLCSLEILQLVFPERFTLAGLDDRMRTAGQAI